MPSPVERMIDAACLGCSCCGRDKDLCACWNAGGGWCPNRPGCGKCFRCCTCEVEQPDLPTRIRRSPRETPREYLIRRYVAAAMLTMRQVHGVRRYPPDGAAYTYDFEGGRTVRLIGSRHGSLPEAWYFGPEGVWELGWGASAPVCPRLVEAPDA